MTPGPIASPPRLPPIWLLGLTNLLFGFVGGVALMTTPQLLAAQHVPEPQIARITSLAMIPYFAGFLLAPLLDVRFSRRTYAGVFGVLASLLSIAATLNIGETDSLRWLLLATVAAAALYNIAIGGWLGDLIGETGGSRLGAWFTVGNIGGFGIGAIANIALFRGVAAPFGAIGIGALVAAPLLLLPFVPAPDADGRRGAKESFTTLFRDIRLLIRGRDVLRLLLVFCLPCASFALTNTLGGLGHVYRASEAFVATLAGIGGTIAGVAGSLLVPPLARRIAPLLLYLLIGGVGAAFTATLIVLPHTPAVFAVAMIGENVAQAAAFSAATAIIFAGIGRDNPLAATQFGLLGAAYALPVTYMQVIDGDAYGRGGMTGMLATDAGITLFAALLLVVPVLRWARGGAAA
ncbi:MFS transporter [Sphingomonas sp.]|uniref:MFS transporter n=1 Tax=Sphingomonas sp. TaxID=28214 RepID=UPI003CC637B4